MCVVVACVLMSVYPVVLETGLNKDSEHSTLLGMMRKNFDVTFLKIRSELKLLLHYFKTFMLFSWWCFNVCDIMKTQAKSRIKLLMHG